MFESLAGVGGNAHGDENTIKKKKRNLKKTEVEFPTVTFSGWFPIIGL